LTHVFAQFDSQARKSSYVKPCLGQNFLVVFQDLITNNEQWATSYGILGLHNISLFGTQAKLGEKRGGRDGMCDFWK